MTPTAPGRPPTWTATSARPTALATGILLLAAGLLTARPDIGLLGVPVLLTALWTTPPTRTITAHLDEPTGETHPGELTATLVLHTQQPPDDTRPTTPHLAHLRITAPGHRDTETLLTLDPTGRTLPLRLASIRTGPQDTFDITLRAHDTAGLHEQPPTTLHGSRRLVLPTTTPPGAAPLPTALRGTTGPHTSRRLGDGTELRDIHPFAPGDNPRRIDWRATARRSPNLDELHVRRTLATAEATAILVIDSRDDIGPDIRTWRGYGTRRPDEATSLDLARRAAASIAEHLITHGDRVGIEDLALRRRPLPPATGQRHLRRLTHSLALAHPTNDRAIGHRLRPPRIPAGAIVYLFTTLLDDETPRLVTAWRTLGHPVIIISTLPEPRPIHWPHLRLAWQLLRMERDDRIATLEHTGTPVIDWNHTAPHRLRTLTRTTRQPHPTHQSTP